MITHDTIVSGIKSLKKQTKSYFIYNGSFYEAIGSGMGKQTIFLSIYR